MSNSHVIIAFTNSYIILTLIPKGANHKRSNSNEMVDMVSSICRVHTFGVCCGINVLIHWKDLSLILVS